MLYVDFKAGNKEYKLRLNTRNTVALEKQLGFNPIRIFGDGERLPTVTEMSLILYYSLQQLNHGISLDNTYDIFDEWKEEGNSDTDFIAVILDIFKVSGLIKGDKTGEDNEKN